MIPAATSIPYHGADKEEDTVIVATVRLPSRYLLLPLLVWEVFWQQRPGVAGLAKIKTMLAISVAKDPPPPHTIAKSNLGQIHPLSDPPLHIV